MPCYVMRQRAIAQSGSYMQPLQRGYHCVLVSVHLPLAFLHLNRAALQAAIEHRSIVAILGGMLT